jgi:cholesterol 7-desaturase
VWYHAENEEPWDLPEMDLSGMILHGTNEFIINSHVQDIPENGADNGNYLLRKFSSEVNLNFSAHLSTVHGPSVTTGDDIRSTRSSCLSIGTHIWEAK